MRTLVSINVIINYIIYIQTNVIIQIITPYLRNLDKKKLYYIEIVIILKYQKETIFLWHIIRQEGLANLTLTGQEGQKETMSILSNNICKWVTEQNVKGMVKKQTLL